MLDINKNNLFFNKAILDTDIVKVNYYSHQNGEPVLSVTLEKPSGTVFFYVDEVELLSFYKSNVNLQHLFEKRTADTFTVLDDVEMIYNSENDMQIKLQEGEKFIQQIITGNK